MSIKAFTIGLSAAVLLQSCGGGGGGASGFSDRVIIEASPSVVESPHPAVWEVASPAEIGFDATLLDQAFDYAMTDGFFTQAALVIKDGKLINESYRGMTESEANVMAEKCKQSKLARGFILARHLQ